MPSAGCCLFVVRYGPRHGSKKTYCVCWQYIFVLFWESSREEETVRKTSSGDRKREFYGSCKCFYVPRGDTVPLLPKPAIKDRRPGRRLLLPFHFPPQADRGSSSCRKCTRLHFGESTEAVVLVLLEIDLVDSSPRLWLMKTNPRARGARVGKRPTGREYPGQCK